MTSVRVSECVEFDELFNYFS